MTTTNPFSSISLLLRFVMLPLYLGSFYPTYSNVSGAGSAPLRVQGGALTVKVRAEKVEISETTTDGSLQ